MFGTPLTIAGFPASARVDVNSDETQIQLTISPFLNIDNSPVATLVIRKQPGTEAAQYETSVTTLNTKYTNDSVVDYDNAGAIVLDMCKQWQSISKSIANNYNEAARKLVSLAQSNQWDEVLLHTALIADPLAPLGQSDSYNGDKKHSAQSSNVASMFFRDPALMAAKSKFMVYIQSADDFSELDADEQCKVRIMLTLLSKIPACVNGDVPSWLVTSLLLERDNVAGYLEQLNSKTPVFHNAKGEVTTPLPYLWELMSSRPCLHDHEANEAAFFALSSDAQSG